MISNKFDVLSKIDSHKMIIVSLFWIVFSLTCYQLIQFFFPPKLVSIPLTKLKVKSEFKMTSNAALFKIPLFGVYVPNLPENIKPSSLNAKIVGIIYAKNPQESQVIIQVNGQEKIYVIGDMIPGGAEIKRINEKGIVIFYNGALEKLTLPKTLLNLNKPIEPLIEN